TCRVRVSFGAAQTKGTGYGTSLLQLTAVAVWAVNSEHDFPQGRETACRRGNAAGAATALQNSLSTPMPGCKNSAIFIATNRLHVFLRSASMRNIYRSLLLLI